MKSSTPITDTINQAEEFKTKGDNALREVLKLEKSLKPSESKDSLLIKYKSCLRHYHNANLFLRYL